MNRAQNRLAPGEGVKAGKSENAREENRAYCHHRRDNSS
jgi:hypothetical protein